MHCAPIVPAPGPPVTILSEVRTFARLLGFLRPYRAGVVWSFALAALAMVFTVAIPWLTGRAIDQVRAGRHGRRC